MTEQECRALFFKEAYVLASSEPEMYRGFKIGLKVGAAAEREACRQAVHVVAVGSGLTDEAAYGAYRCEDAIRARREQ